jgi:3'-phosphoadenosine 5'-phosphosulfate sulfotransferase (PAPS reductase)/FAD synthetase
VSAIVEKVGLTPDEIVSLAESRHNIVARFCLFSGGNDSSVVAHRSREHYDTLVHINTGTALPGVEEFCHEFAAWLEKPLIVLRTPFSEYRRLVLGSDTPRANGKPDQPLGFPGPGNHGACYWRLKQARLEELMRSCKKRYSRERILLITGIRRSESQKRSKREPIRFNNKNPGIWVNPLIDWDATDMLDYRERHGIPQSDVAALLHKSGECNCGAYAPKGERETLIALYPEWWAETMGPLEDEAAQAGLTVTRWGQGQLPKGVRNVGGFPMCDDCELTV